MHVLQLRGRGPRRQLRSAGKISSVPSTAPTAVLGATAAAVPAIAVSGDRAPPNDAENAAVFLAKFEQSDALPALQQRGRRPRRPKSARLQWHRRRGPVCGSRRSRLDCRIRRENYPKCWQLLTAGSQSRLLRSRRASSRHRAHGLSADRAPRRPAQTGLRGPAAAAVRPPGPCGRVSCARAADADCAPRRRDRAPGSADRAPRFPPPTVSPRVRPAVKPPAAVSPCSHLSVRAT